MSASIITSEQDLRYPIGRYEPATHITAQNRANWLRDLEELPAKLRATVAGLNQYQLDTPYRPGGWTVRQVVHHLPDSHLNSYVRFRLALTENSPAIKTYEEAAWAELPDARTAPIEISLNLLEALHARWLALLTSLTDADFARTFQHPEWGNINLEWTLGMYAWHSRHHVAQITSLRKREGW
ncbi:MAG: bacillithiol transferase BstA [Acidobacteriaceae bacterium]|nr:bacillithiol transferase BstA [Acidobacteriaceae bacterium]MBV9778706.1 bacillithiol transferase BstA [Acidobacteriaceae bacterium]